MHLKLSITRTGTIHVWLSEVARHQGASRGSTFVNLSLTDEQARTLQDARDHADHGDITVDGIDGKY